ncbi:hypothetical protein BVI2075_320193 [Burkholderia vietnamiensis]|nr:hypothetical protein BVI2075_320193 [Burkholderia vietnamiensis]
MAFGGHAQIRNISSRIENRRFRPIFLKEVMMRDNVFHITFAFYEVSYQQDIIFCCKKMYPFHFSNAFCRDAADGGGDVDGLAASCATRHGRRRPAVWSDTGRASNRRTPAPCNHKYCGQ